MKGIGKQTAVQTAYAAETAATPAETVMFEYSDAMGVSYRTTDKLAAPVAYGDGGEGSPIETDPLGGSVGTSTPYFQPIVYQPEPQYPDLDEPSKQAIRTTMARLDPSGPLLRLWQRGGNCSNASNRVNFCLYAHREWCY